MPTYETGRTREIVYEVSGNLESKIVHQYPGFSFIAEDGGCDFYFYFLPTTLNQPYLRFSNLPSAFGYLGWGVNAGVFLLGENSDGDLLEPDDYNVDYTLTSSEAFEGSVTIPGVKEVFEIVDLPVGDYSTISGSKFPSFGGTAQADGITARKITYYEIIPEGTTIVITGTIGGATATYNWVTPEDIVMGYPVKVEGSGTYGTSVAPTTGEVNASWQVAFQGEQLVADWGTITPDSQGSFTDWFEGKARAVAVSSGALGEFTNDLYLAPPITYDCYFKAFCFGSNYPGTIGLWLWDKATWSGSSWDQSYKTVSANPTNYERVDQEYYILTGGTNFTSNTNVDLQEWQGIRWNLDPANLNGEDADDWRVQIRGTQWKCYDVLQNTTFTLDNGNSAMGWSGGANTTYSNTGSAHRAVVSGGPGSISWSATKNLEGFRYLGLRIKATGANKPFTLRLTHTDGEDKEYSGVTGAAGTFSTVIIDLCKPDNVDDDDDTADDDVYTQDSRYPLEGGASSVPTLSDALWGFNVFDTLTIEGLENGETYEVDYIELKRDIFGKLSFLPAFEPWKDGYTSNQVKSQFWTNADGRICDDHLATKTTTPSYTWLAITAFESALERRLGWEATLGGTLPADGYHTNSLEALMIEGGGVRWEGGSTFVPAWNLDVTATKEIRAQALWDEIQAYPYAGDIWNYGAYGEITEVGAAKQLRGGLWGIVLNSGSLAPESGATVTLKTDPGGASAGSGSTDGQGFYSTGTPWGKNGSHKAFCAAVISPSFEVFNRLPHRRCFSIFPDLSNWVWNLSTSWGHYFRTNAIGSGIRVRRTKSHFPDGSWAEDSAVGQSGDRRPTMFEYGSAMDVHLIWERLGTVLSSKSLDDGRSWSEPIEVMAGYYPTGNASKSGWRIIASLEFDSGDTGPGKIRIRRQGPGEATLSTPLYAKDETAADIKVEEGTFHIFPANDSKDTWILSAIAEGSSEPSEWVSYDFGLTYKKQ